MERALQVSFWFIQEPPEQRPPVTGKVVQIDAGGIMELQMAALLLAQVRQFPEHHHCQRQWRQLQHGPDGCLVGGRSVAEPGAP